MDRSLYPANWEAFSLDIRVRRAMHRCECTGECGQHRGQRCTEINKQKARWHVGRVILTVAHLCNCYPICATADHVKAMCQKCHLRTDLDRHRASRLRTIRKAPRAAQPYRRAANAASGGIMPELRRLSKKKRTRLWFPPAI
jgi:hypothetical protein